MKGKLLITHVLMVTLIAFSTIAPATASVTPGKSCAKAGQKQTFQGRVYTCIKSGKKTFWNKGVLVKPSPSPSPSPSIQNNLLGMTWMQKSNGLMNLSMVVNTIKSKEVFFLDGVNYQTAYPDNFIPLDIWDNKILACPTFCTTNFYISALNSIDPKLISLDKILHPDLYSYAILKGANFGTDSRYVFALTTYQPIKGVNSVVYRIDTVTGLRTPIYATYCTASASESCAFGYTISGVRADHQSDQLLLSVDSIHTPSAGYTANFLMTISQNAGAISIKPSTELETEGFRFWEYGELSNATFQLVNNVKDGTTTSGVKNLQFLERGEIVYIRTSGDIGLEINQICQLRSPQAETCNPIAPFARISDIISLGDGLILYETFNFNTDQFFAGIYDLFFHTLTPVSNYTLKTKLRSFSIG